MQQENRKEAAANQTLLLVGAMASVVEELARFGIEPKFHEMIVELCGKELIALF